MAPVRTVEFRTIGEGALAGTLAFIVQVDPNVEQGIEDAELLKLIDNFHAKQVPHLPKMVLFSGDFWSGTEEVIQDLQNMNYKVLTKSRYPGAFSQEADYRIALINTPITVTSYYHEYRLFNVVQVTFLPSILQRGTAIFLDGSEVDPSILIRTALKYPWRTLPASRRTLGVKIYG